MKKEFKIKYEYIEYYEEEIIIEAEDIKSAKDKFNNMIPFEDFQPEAGEVVMTSHKFESIEDYQQLKYDRGDK